MKKVVIYIQSTDGGVKKYIEKGFWERQKFALSQIAKEFTVYYYSGDLKPHQDRMPDGVIHKVSPINISLYGLSHISFYLYLIYSSFFWKEHFVVRVWGTSIPVLGIVKAISKVKIVVSYQYDWASGVKKDYRGIKTWVADWVQKSVLNSADGIIFTMDWLLTILKKKYSKENVILIPNFVNTDEFKPSVHKKNYIIFCGRLHWSKGVEELIKAFLEFNKVNPSWKLLIVGDGEEKAKLINLKGNNENVLFLGRQTYDKVAQHLNEAKIFVLPTKTMEGHPKAMVEAMAAGCISIASNVPGNKDILTEANSAELIFESGNVNDLVKKLELALQYSRNGYTSQYDFAASSYSHKILIPREIEFLNSFLIRK